MTTNILFICGSLNQTMIMHKISRHLPEFRCVFTPFYADGLIGQLARTGLLDFSILGGRHRRNTLAYLQEAGLPVDFEGKSNDYDIVVTCTDLIIQNNLRNKRIILVQEGMTEPEGWLYQLVRHLKLPRYLANTAATGLSDAYEVFCVASPGYRDFFISKGIRPEKIVVTGIPNFDNAAAYQTNNFPYKGYVLVATSSIRETFGWDNRIQFIREAKRIAAGRQLIFKIHPNENVKIVCNEIKQHAPDAIIYKDGNLHHMIANCDVLVTQYTSAVYTGIALGKGVYSYYDTGLLRRLLPVQNGGASAKIIANVCRLLHKAPWQNYKSAVKRYRARQRQPVSHAA